MAESEPTTPTSGASPARAEESSTPAASPGAPRPNLPVSYDRTWELELLISGAVAFALLQLPGAVDSGFERLSARLGEGLHQVTVFAYIYFKIILYALISTFIIHLAARAYWVGLVGLTSVYPGGVRWEETKYGPITREFYQERLPSLQEQTARVDRFCSILFSFASIIVLTFVSSTIIVTLFGGLSWFIADRFFGGERDMLVFYLIMTAIAVPMLLASQLDKRWGDRLGGGARERIRDVLRVMWFTQLGSVTSTLSNTIFSNINRRKSVGAFYLVFAMLLGFFMVRDVLIRMGGAAPDGYRYLPEAPGALSVAFQHYENRQPEGMVNARMPTIQSDIVRDPFVRLFLPYLPRRHNELVAERCPELATESPEATADLSALQRRDQLRLECLAAMQPVTLNGEPLAGLRFHHYTQPATGIQGMISYISTEGMNAGENLLVVGAIPRPVRGETSEREPESPHYIRFWLAQ